MRTDGGLSTATCAAGLAALVALAPPSVAQRPHRVAAVDAATGRGVPLVELTTVNEITWVTDSAGVAAVHEPGLMGQEVWFRVESHGYELPADGFGNRGVRVMLTAGGSTTLRLDRRNVAERLYRVTGQGIYRDSVLLGDRPPVQQPLIAGGVLGQDSVVNAVLGGRLLWFWGDTNRAAYPLGNFATSGAWSMLPAGGGLDPDVGIDLHYWVDERGFSRPMCPIDGPGPVWIDGLAVLPDAGRDRLFCHYARMKDLGTRHEHGIARWDEQAERFLKERDLPLDHPLHAHGHPFRAVDAGVDWLWFPSPYPAVRVAARLDDLLDPSRYEAFTCLRPGSRWRGDQADLERDADGHLVWAFKRDTAPVSADQWRRLAAGRLVQDRESWLSLHDVETGERVQGHGGSVAWSEWRQRWVMIALQAFGRSALGEVWYAEADHPLGPWVWARRIVTHDRYSFYNVRHHPYFDRDRWLYFEGTYTATFSGNDRKTPRYDYNQILYRLDLSDPRLVLPEPIYRVDSPDGPIFLSGRSVGDRRLWRRVQDIAFAAWPAARAPRDSLTIGESEARALPPVEATAPSPPLVPLFVWRETATGRVDYRTAGDAAGTGWTRGAAPVARVWPPHGWVRREP